MKKFFSILLVVACLMSCGVSAFAEIPSIDGLSQGELIELRTRINEKVIVADKGTTVYDDEGFVIKWMGYDIFPAFGEDYIRNNLLITNPTDNTIRFYISIIAINGIQVSIQWLGEYEIGAGLTFISSSSTRNMWLLSDLESLGLSLDDVTDIYIEFAIYDKPTGDKIKTGELRIAVA